MNAKEPGAPTSQRGLPARTNEELNAAIVRDLAQGDPLAVTNEGPIGQTTEVGCVFCGAIGPPPSDGDDFQHELFCPWLRAVVMQMGA